MVTLRQSLSAAMLTNSAGPTPVAQSWWRIIGLVILRLFSRSALDIGQRQTLHRVVGSRGDIGDFPDRDGEFDIAKPPRHLACHHRHFHARKRQSDAAMNARAESQ